MTTLSNRDGDAALPIGLVEPPWPGAEAPRPHALHDELAIGRRRLSAIFRSSPPRSCKPGELLSAIGGPRDMIYRLRAGWACRVLDLSGGRRAVLDVYLPGDVIGLDRVLRARAPEQIVTLTSVTAEAVPAEHALMTLMEYRPTAVYVAWLLGQSQRRAYRFLAAMSCLDARGRVAMMVLDFYMRLRSRRAITGLTYNLPLTQIQIGHYLGLTVVHINRVLRILRDERIVSFEKHCVTIVDLERLSGLAQSADMIKPPQPSASAPPEIALSKVEAAD